MIVAGIDEAGRGPVIGPMVMAICTMAEEKMGLLEELGVKDSKLLSEKKREFLFEKVKELCEHEILIIFPREIDDALNSEGMNLNKLEALYTGKLVGLREADKYIIDCPSNNIDAYTKHMKSLVRKDANLVLEHKADLNNVIVAAASILAKVTRDREIMKLKMIAKEDFGSGYPSDPKTVSFLRRNWNKYDFFRKSWETYKKVASNTTQSSLKQF